MIESVALNPIILESRVFVFGGTYSNLQATKAILEQAKNQSYTRDQIIFTGDTVAYCGQPQETVDLIRDNVKHLIQGNCEESLGANSNNCGCGFEDGSTCSLLSAEWYNFCRTNLDANTKSWMGSLPKSLRLQLGDFHLSVLHASPNSINEFVFPSDIENSKLQLPVNDPFDGYIVGHSGLPFIATFDDKAWINSGAAGMPANDGTSKIWYATIECQNGMLLAETHSLEYEFREAENAMKCVGLENGYKECLRTGIWPSHDVLPAFEMSRTGCALRPQRAAFKKRKYIEVA